MQLRASLEVLKLTGCAFEDAWELAWREVIWPHDTDHRRQWKAALKETRPEWGSCYIDGPTVTHGNLPALASALLPHEDVRGEVTGVVAA